jgi:orotate phosphoribosyltransferase
MSLLKLLKEKAYEKKEVTLASGRKSNFYIDVKRVSLTAEGSAAIGEEFFNLIQDKFPETKGIGGLTLGADPLATAVAIISFQKNHPLDAFIIRKELKAHGTGKMIEGGHTLPKDSPIVILEDVVTSGGSSLEAVSKAKEHGWKVLGVASVVDRQEGGQEKLEKAGIKLYSLYQRSDFGNFED